MGWPSIGDYNAAFHNPGGKLLAPSLAGARCKPGPLGTPMPLSGGYALIYEVILPDGKRKAVRCYTEEDGTRQARAAAACLELKNTLARAPALKDYFAATDWEALCLNAGGRIVPAMVMDWIEGQTLGQYIEARHGDPGALRTLRANLAALARDLEAHGVVHGDLQTGNIVVAPNGGVKLLDYDGLSFARQPDAPELEAGHVNFQHPTWSAGSPRSLKDRFPAISIDLGLAALIEHPGLFERFSTGENILFVRDDYAAPDESKALDAVREIPALATAAELFAGLCDSAVDIVPSLEEFRRVAYVGEGRTRSAAAEAETATTAAPAGATASVGASAEKAAAPRKKTSKKAKIRERGAYAGPYSVFSGTDFHGIESAVGRKIEVVGRIVSVKADGLTKYGKPFAFINFTDWRGDGFKLTIWSEGLETLSQAPSASWVGRWISAVGLVDEPYFNDHYLTTQLSITIQDSSQLRFIDAAEAAYRLGRPPPKADLINETNSSGQSGEGIYDATIEAESFEGASNAGLVASLGRSGYGTAPIRNPASIRGGYASRQGAPVRSSNSQLLSELAAPQDARNPATSPSSTYSSPAGNTTNSSANGGGCIKFLFWAIVILVSLAMMGVFNYF